MEAWGRRNFPPPLFLPGGRLPLCVGIYIPFLALLLRAGEELHGLRDRRHQRVIHFLILDGCFSFVTLFDFVFHNASFLWEIDKLLPIFPQFARKVRKLDIF